MTGRVVCDASAVVALLVDSGLAGQWAAAQTARAELYAPALLPYECANIFRRHERMAVISPDQAAQAHSDLIDLPVDLWPYDAVAERVWSLRPNLTSYDAAYVAVAEAIDATLVTLDRRLARAPGVPCRVEAPDL